MEQFILDRIDVINEAMYYNEIETLESLVDYYDKQMTMEMCRNHDVNCMSYLMMEEEVPGASEQKSAEVSQPNPQAPEATPAPEQAAQKTEPETSTPAPAAAVPKPDGTSATTGQKQDIAPPAAENKGVGDQSQEKKDVQGSPNQADQNQQNGQSQNKDPKIPKTNFEKIMNTISEFFKNIIDGLKTFFNKVFNNQRVVQVQQNIVYVQNVKNECPDWDAPFEKLQDLIISGKLQGGTNTTDQTTGESYIDDIGVDYTSYFDEFYEEHEYVPYCEFAKDHNYTYQEGYTFESVVDALTYLIKGTLEIQFRNLEWLKNLAPFTSAYNAANLVRDTVGRGYGYDKAADAADANASIKNEKFKAVHKTTNDALGKIRTYDVNKGVVQSYWNVILGALDRLQVEDGGIADQSALDVIKDVYDPINQTLFGLPLPKTLTFIMTNGTMKTIGNGVKAAADKVSAFAGYGGGVDDNTLASGLDQIGFIPGPIKNLIPKIGAHGAIVWIIIDLIKKTRDRKNDPNNLDDNWVDATFSVVNMACENFFGIGENLGKSLSNAIENAEHVNQTRDAINETRDKMEELIEAKYNGEGFNEAEYNKYMEQLANLCKELDDGLKKVDDFFTMEKSKDGDAHMTLLEILNANGDTVPKQQKALSRLLKCITVVDQGSQSLFRKIRNAIKNGDSRIDDPEIADKKSRQNGGLGTRTDVNEFEIHDDKDKDKVIGHGTNVVEREWSTGTKALLTVTKKLSVISDIIKGLSNLQADVFGFLRGIFTSIQIWHNQNVQDSRDAKLNGGEDAGIFGTDRAKEAFNKAMKENVENSEVATGIKNFVDTDMDDVNPAYHTYSGSRMVPA